MAKFCPVQNRKVLYLECLECEQKECRKEKITERILTDQDIKVKKCYKQK